MADLLHELLFDGARRRGDAPCLGWQGGRRDYAAVAAEVEACARGLVGLDLGPGERVAVYMPKRLETVTALFGAAAAGGILVPVNPLLKPHQVAHILRDSGARVLVTTPDRAPLLAAVLPECHDLHTVVATDDGDGLPGAYGHVQVAGWQQLLEAGPAAVHRRIDADPAALLYTSGSTGRPKGVVLSHRNLVAGARSVAGYLGHTADDRLLAVLPLSFDYGFSQLSTAFVAGASVVLMEYLLPRDVVAAVAREGITGLAAVPPLWVQLAGLEWPAEATTSLRYLTSSGGAMPRPVLDTLRRRLPRTSIYLMYGLTEAFRSTYLPPEELDRRPDSIGRAIPNAEVLVVREDGSPCEPNEPGELVHRGALVALGYWNDPQGTAARFRPAPGGPEGVTAPAPAVWSGDTVRMDAEGYLYFIGRRDDLIKTSGYRVSPTEVEEVLYGSGLVAEAAALGIPHPTLGEAILVVVSPRGDTLDREALLVHCRRELPGFMVPRAVETLAALPRNANGKIDRDALAESHQARFLADSGP